jgi:hypothetical protein
MQEVSDLLPLVPRCRARESRLYLEADSIAIMVDRNRDACLASRA